MTQLVGNTEAASKLKLSLFDASNFCVQTSASEKAVTKGFTEDELSLWNMDKIGEKENSRLNEKAVTYWCYMYEQYNRYPKLQTMGIK